MLQTHRTLHTVFFLTQTKSKMAIPLYSIQCTKPKVKWRSHVQCHAYIYIKDGDATHKFVELCTHIFVELCTRLTHRLLLFTGYIKQTWTPNSVPKKPETATWQPFLTTWNQTCHIHFIFWKDKLIKAYDCTQF